MQTPDDLFSAFSPKPLAVCVLGQTVYIRPIPAGEVAAIKEWEQAHPGDSYLILCDRSLCTPDGTRMFADADADRIAGLPASAVEAITDEVMKLNRMGTYAGKAPSPDATT